jgi:regulation of enolase protein 1 (concanavalin A-like superfamily)
MVGTAKGAMRNPRFKKLPRLEPVAWVVHNKIRLLLGGKIDFQRYVDYQTVRDETPAPDRPSHLNETVKRRIQTKNDQHYSQPGGYINE